MDEYYTREALEELYPDGTVNIMVGHEVRPMTTEEWSEWIDREVGQPTEIGYKIKQARQKRDRLLASSDYRMVTDAPWDITAWATYRQELRDLPDDPAWPDVQFPVPPDAKV